MDSKTQIRQTILAKRSSLTEDFLKTASHRIVLKLLSLEEFVLSERLGLYAAFRNEVLTDEIFQKSHALRKEIYYPKVNTQKREVQFYRVHSLKELKAGFAGILEPSKGHPLTDIRYLNMMIVPGVAFDRQGNRVGFGLGYYDRLLEKFLGKRVALAFEFQVVEELPKTPRDERLDFIITEERILKIS